jgi:hypothetical protein
MPHVPRELFQAWTRSFEEDEGDVQVYRPAASRFPAARQPRDGLEFRPDGTVSMLKPGRADRRERVEGRWYAGGPGLLRVSRGPGAGDASVEIVQVDDTILKVRGVP